MSKRGRKPKLDIKELDLSTINPNKLETSDSLKDLNTTTDIPLSDGANLPPEIQQIFQEQIKINNLNNNQEYIERKCDFLHKIT